MFLRLPQISAGSPNMYCLTYRIFLTFMKLMKMQLGSLEKILISSPGIVEGKSNRPFGIKTII